MAFPHTGRSGEDDDLRGTAFVDASDYLMDAVADFPMNVRDVVGLDGSVIANDPIVAEGRDVAILLAREVFLERLKDLHLLKGERRGRRGRGAHGVFHSKK